MVNTMLGPDFLEPLHSWMDANMVLQRQYADMPHLPLSLAKPMHELSGSVGIPADQIRFFICLLLSFPLGVIHRQLPSATLKHIFSLVMGVFFVWFVTGVAGTIHPFVSGLCVYFIVKTVPYKKAGGAVFWFTMIYMSLSHVYRIYFDYMGWSLDFTSAQMIVTIKFCTFAYNYSDGIALRNKDEMHPKVVKFRQEHSIEQLPSLLEFFSFVFFYPAVLAGPAFEIKEYLEFTDGTLFKKHGLPGVPNSLVPTLKCVFFAACCYVPTAMQAKFPVMGVVTTDKWVQDTTFLYRAVYVYIGMTCFRAKYHFAWYMAEAGCQASGFGFNGFRDKEKKVMRWSRCNNSNILKVDFSCSLNEITSNWNKGANNWLKNYVYFRMDAHKPGRKQLANVATKLTSAVWHGFYPAYYLFFLSIFFVNAVGDGFRRMFHDKFYKVGDDGVDRPKNVVLGIVYNVGAWLILFFPMNYMGASFLLLRADWTYACWKSLYFFGHICVFAGYAFVTVMKPKRKRRPTEKKKQ